MIIYNYAMKLFVEYNSIIYGETKIAFKIKRLPTREDLSGRLH